MITRVPGSPLPPAFFCRPAEKVARDLIGQFLVRQAPSPIIGMITETEAYLGPHDLASHTARGLTPRTEVMFRGGGHIYVYRIYGLHWMLNFVTGMPGDGAAVLIRGVECISGPGRVANAFGVDLSLNGSVLGEGSGLCVAAAEHRIPQRRIIRTARIGIDYAGPSWSKRKLRFVLRASLA